MSGQIFISYRREDASSAAGRLYDRLATHFHQNQIFMDIDNIPPGIDFVEAIEKSVGSCDVLIAVIGRRWLMARDEKRRRRLDNPEDFVRLEIGTALKRGIRVIPVLVEQAVMPRSADLPEDLKALVRRQALAVSHDRFTADSERLISAIERVLETARPEWQRECEERKTVEAGRRAEPRAQKETTPIKTSATCPPEEKSYEVFISFAFENRQIAEAVCEQLERADVRCWLAPRNIPPGLRTQAWSGAIINGIRSSRIMVLILSQHANKSVQVKREVEVAFQAGLTVIPFRVENIEPEGTLEHFLASVQWLDATMPPLTRDWDRLVNRVREALNELA